MVSAEESVVMSEMIRKATEMVDHGWRGPGCRTNIVVNLYAHNKKKGPQRLFGGGVVFPGYGTGTWVDADQFTEQDIAALYKLAEQVAKELWGMVDSQFGRRGSRKYRLEVTWDGRLLACRDDIPPDPEVEQGWIKF